MAHPLYARAINYVGRPVYAYHMNGLVYSGRLTHVTPAGIYLLNCRTVTSLVGFEDTVQKDVSILTDQQKARDGDIASIFYPGSYFAFGALAGLGLGLAAAW